MRIEWRRGEAWITDKRLRQVRRFGAVRVDAMLAVIRDKIEAIEDAEPVTERCDPGGHGCRLDRARRVGMVAGDASQPHPPR